MVFKYWFMGGSGPFCFTPLLLPPCVRLSACWTTFHRTASMHSCWALLFIIFPALIVPSLSSSDPARTNLTLYGDAHFTANNAISLTQELKCPSPSPPPLPLPLPPPPPPSSSSSGVGRAFYVYPIRFRDPTTKATASFSSRFSFSVAPSPYCPAGEGFAFLITSNPNSFSLLTGFMGLPDPARSAPQDSFVAVEFDTNYDPSLGDINGNHVGVDLSTVVSSASADALSRGIVLSSGRPITAWIEYRDAVKLIRVWVGNSPNRPPSPLLSAQIDLSQQFKEFMHVGFSASNGKGSAVYTVEHWRFRTFQFAPSVVPADPAEEGDCFMCSLESSSVHGSPDKKRISLTLGLGGLAAFLVSIFAVLAIFIFFLIRRKVQVGRPEEVQEWDRRGPTRLSLSDIRSATIGFHRNRVVGEGASARVYKGYLPSGKPVAVKRFNPIDRIGSVHNPFTTEFATMIGCLQHKNLVQLQGWCSEGNEMILVYEYLPNGSLEKMLHKNSDSATLLTWKHRLNIVLGVASALTYLHEECEMQIIHRDVKTCNIMLDADFNAKLGDFGLAEVYEHSCVTRVATIPAGTMGYLAPEYVYSGVPTTKTDVYSFGVVMLEVATGRKPVDDDGKTVVDLVWELWEMGRLMEAVDGRLGRMFTTREVERMLVVGLCCAHPNHDERPTVQEAARVLRGEAPCPLLPAKKPRVIIHSVLPHDSSEIRGNHSPGLEDSQWMTPRSHFG